MRLVGHQYRHNASSGRLHIIAPNRTFRGFTLRAAGNARAGPLPPQVVRAALHALNFALHPDPLLLEHRYLLGGAMLHHRHVLREILQLQLQLRDIHARGVDLVKKGRCFAWPPTRYGPGMRYSRARRNHEFILANVPVIDARAHLCHASRHWHLGDLLLGSRCGKGRSHLPHFLHTRPPVDETRRRMRMLRSAGVHAYAEIVMLLLMQLLRADTLQAQLNHTAGEGNTSAWV